MSLTATRLVSGVWEGELTGATPGSAPSLDVMHLNDTIGPADVTADPDRADAWRVRVPIPSERISDGVQTFVIVDQSSGERLSSFTILAGEALDDDIRAEIDLLRSELDLLKRAFRRHCLES